MTDIHTLFRINLSTNLTEDFVKETLSTNSNGSINIRYTIASIREKIYHDIEILDQLLSCTKDIKSMIIDPETESIICNISKSKTINKLREIGALEEEESDFSDDDETDRECIQMLKNIVTTADLREIDISNGADSPTHKTSETPETPEISEIPEIPETLESGDLFENPIQKY